MIKIWLSSLMRRKHQGLARTPDRHGFQSIAALAQVHLSSHNFQHTKSRQQNLSRLLCLCVCLFVTYVTLPAYCIPKVVRLKTGEVLYEKSYMSPRPPPKISLRHDHEWTRGKVQLGSTVDQRPEGKIVRQSRGEVQHATFSQLTQPIPKPICDRSGQPDNTQDVFVVEGETSRSHEIDEKGFHE